MNTTGEIMKKEDLLPVMRDVLIAIYKKDVSCINKTFAIMIEELMKFIDYASIREGRVINIDDELMKLEQGYMKKDYIFVADMIQASIYQKL